MNYKRVLVLSSSIIFLFMVMLPASAFPWEDEVETEDWWASDNTWTRNGELGYTLNTSKLEGETFAVIGQSGAQVNASWSVRLYLVDANNVSTELTTGYTDLTFTMEDLDNETIHTLTFTLTSDQTLGGRNEEVIKADINMRLGAGSWVVGATFVTDFLASETLLADQWSLSVTARVVYYEDPIFMNYAYTYWGSDDRYFFIDDVTMEKSNPFDIMSDHLGDSDFISFTIEPWAYYMGTNMFWGFVLLFCEMTLYLKYEDYRICLLFLWLFGGGGGVLTSMVPAVGMHLSWFIIALAMAATLFVMMK